jgi:hypothetical protein
VGVVETVFGVSGDCPIAKERAARLVLDVEIRHRTADVASGLDPPDGLIVRTGSLNATLDPRVRRHPSTPSVSDRRRRSRGRRQTTDAGRVPLTDGEAVAAWDP